MNRIVRKTIIFALVVIALGALIHQLKQCDYLSLENLNAQKHFLITFVEQHYALASFLFILSYILFAALLLPGAGFLSITGGLLFGVLIGTIYVAIGATIGAFSAFLTTRYFIGNQIQKKYSTSLAKFNDAFAQYGPLYLFIVRLIPFFPFFLVNMLAGLTKVSARTFITTTAVGVLPLVIGLTYLGAQLRHSNTVEDFFTYPLAIAGLIILLPIVIHMLIKKWRRHKQTPAI